MLFDHPDIAEVHGVAVILQLERSGGVRFLFTAGQGAFHFHVVVDDDAVVTDGRLGKRGPFGAVVFTRARITRFHVGR